MAVLLTLVLRAVKAPDGVDETEPGDYHADLPSEYVVVTAARELAGEEDAVKHPARHGGRQ